MENNELEVNQVNDIIKYLLNGLCHDCIETICNTSLKQVMTMKKESQYDRRTYYIELLKQRLAHLKLKDDYYCNEHYDEEFEDSEEDDAEIMNYKEFEKFQNMIKEQQANALKLEKKRNRKRKKKK